MEQKKTDDEVNFLFAMVFTATASFWNVYLLEHPRLAKLFRSANSDVVVAESLIWNFSVLSKLLMQASNFDNDRLSKIVEAKGLMVTQIESITGWRVKNNINSQVAQYLESRDQRELITVFCARVASSIGKRSPFEDDGGRRRLDDTEQQMLMAVINVFFTKSLLPIAKVFEFP